MDFVSSSKNVGSSAFGTSSTMNGSSSANGGLFSNFFNLTIQKMVLLLAVIAFVISIGTVAILLWKSKSTQQWPPEIAKCPDRMEFDGTNCVDKYELGVTGFQPKSTNCLNYEHMKNTLKSYTGSGLTGVDTGYVPWEGIVDGQATRASSLKNCLT